MNIDREWYSRHEREIGHLANHLLFDLGAALRELSQAADGSRAMSPPDLIALLDQAGLSPAETKVRLYFWTYGLLLVREAERSNVPLPGACDDLANWIQRSFLPAYRTTFPEEI
jgi:hypothetical protein